MARHCSLCGLDGADIETLAGAFICERCFRLGRHMEVAA